MKTNFILGIVLMGLAVGTVGPAWAQDETFEGTITGRKTWTIQYGIGDALALALAGVSPGQLQLEQTFAVDIEGGALGILFVEAHFDDREDDSLQSLSIYLDTEFLDGVAGDFVLPEMGSFSSYSRKMKGARLDYTWGDATLTAIVSQLEGVSETKTFVGETEEVTVKYAYVDEDSGGAASYAVNLEGLASFTLKSLFVEEFSHPTMEISTGSGLNTVLSRHGVSDLAVVFDGYAGRKLLSSEWVVVGEDEQNLLLSVAPSVVLRRTIKDAISVYNDEADGDIDYPFATGSEGETEFLSDVLAYASIVVDGDAYDLPDAEHHRFYDLGETDIVLDTVSVEVNPDGSGFRWIGNPSWETYNIWVDVDEGILHIELPETFYANADAALRVTYSYTVLGGTYTLGLAVVPDSERIWLNDRLLVRDVDYMIDYEIGYVALFIEIAEDDELTIEYERYTSGSSDYARYFSGLKADVPLSDTFSFDAYLLQAADDDSSIDDASSVSTMPNRQIVAGVSGSVSLEDFFGNFTVGYGNDRFPFDDNEKTAVPSQIHAIAATSEFVMIGSDGGLSVRESGEWSAYGTSDGLAGRSVRAIAVYEDYAFFGTSAGLTIVELSGVSPFDRTSGWKRIYEAGGLPDASVRALLVDGDTLYVGTDGGVAFVNVEDVTTLSAWTTLLGEEYGKALSLAIDGDSLYVGTTTGLVRADLATGEVETVETTAFTSVYALLVDGDTLYAATDRGVRVYVDGAVMGWFGWGDPTYALGTRDGGLYYGTDDGLVRASDGVVFHSGWKVTAAAESEGALWIGTEADAEYHLWVWAWDDEESAYSNDTMEVDGENPYTYADLSAAEHTATGWTTVASFEQTSDAYSIAGTIVRTMPGYRPIGNSSRTDDAAWTLDGGFALGPNASLDVTHSYEITDVTSNEKNSVLENDATLRLDVGPQIAIIVQQQSEDSDALVAGVETSELTYRFSIDDKFFSDALWVSIDWKEYFLWAVDSADRHNSTLAVDLGLTFLPDWTTTFSWTRPIHVVRSAWSGTSALAWGVEGAASLLGVDLLTEYDLDWSKSLPDGNSKVSHAGRVRLSVDTFSLGEAKFTPNFDLSGALDDGSLSFAGKANLRTVWNALSVRTVVSATVTGVGESVERWTEKTTSTLSFSGIPSIRPTLTYSWSRSVAIKEDGEESVTVVHSATGRATWTSPMGDSDALTASLRVEPGDEWAISGSLDNTYQRDVTDVVLSWFGVPEQEASNPYPSLLVRVDASGSWDAEYDGTEFDWTLTGGADVLLSSMWSASLNITVCGGRTNSGTWYNGMLFGLTAAIDF